jgi:hypothetical protein
MEAIPGDWSGKKARKLRAFSLSGFLTGLVLLMSLLSLFRLVFILLTLLFFYLFTYGFGDKTCYHPFTFVIHAHLLHFYLYALFHPITLVLARVTTRFSLARVSYKRHPYYGSLTIDLWSLSSYPKSSFGISNFSYLD